MNCGKANKLVANTNKSIANTNKSIASANKSIASTNKSLANTNISVEHNRLVSGIGAFYTVEASLIFFIVISAVLLVIYLWFFQYNRCLMEQNESAAIVRATEESGLSPSERIEMMEYLCNTTYRDQTICWEENASKLSYVKDKITTRKEGGMKFPFEKLSFWSAETFWRTECKYSGSVIKPVFIIRTYRKLEGLII